MAIFVKDLCPVCGCRRFRDFGEARQGGAPVRVPDGSRIVACRDCRLIYVNPMPHWSGEEMALLYDDSYFLHLKADERAQWLRMRRDVIPKKRFARIAPHIRAGARSLLEIGAGENAFMCRHLMRQGWRCAAQEPSPLYAEKLREISGLAVETKDITELDGEYSLIFADSVLEHTPAPVNYYKKLAGLLAEGGVLYTVSPSEYSLYNFLRSRAAGAPRYIAPYEQPYHLVGFTKKALQICAKESGLRLAFYRKYNDYMAFQTIHSNKHAAAKYPLALMFALAQAAGLGTNGEALFRK